MARLFTCPTRVYPGLFSYTKLHRTRSLPISFTRAMHSASMAPALAWPDKIDLSGRRLMPDVGGGSGRHSIGAVQRWPNLSAVVLDRPTVCEVAEEFTAREGLAARVKTHHADMWIDLLPSADLHEAGFRETRVEQFTGIESWVGIK
jgi:hypothetical protein